jgi:quinol monooxygenase YgiN
MSALIASFKIDPANCEKFEAEFAKITEAVRANEPGVVYYQLFREREPGAYKVMEVYKDADAIKAHVKSEHFTKMWPQLRTLLVGEPVVDRLEKVG